jgi:predicted aspartyl protease
MLVAIGLAATILQSTTLPFELRGTHTVIGEVRVNGSGPYRFLLDTGAQSSVVDPELASELGLSPQYRVEVITLAGQRFAGGCRALWSVGGMNVGEAETLIYPITGLRYVDRDVHGILGQSFLSKFDYLIDYKRREIVLDRTGVLSQSAKGASTSLKYVAERPAVELDGSVFVLDSGASALILTAKAAKRFGLRLQPGRRISLGTTAEAVEVQTGRLRLLRVGQRLLRDIDVVIAPTTRVEDGLLPPLLAGSVLISNSGGFAVLGAAGKRPGELKKSR